MPKSPKFKFLLMALGLAGGIVIGIAYVREPTQPLTAQRLAQARNLWRASSIRDYDLEYQMQQSRYEVHVRGGIVMDVKVDGRMPTSAEWKSYSMDGLFDILEEDLQNFGAQSGQSVILRARFNARHGYLERYVRSGGGMKPGVIELVRFHIPASDR